MSSKSQRQGSSRTFFKGISLRSVKARYIVAFSLLLITAVVSASALTAEPNQPFLLSANSSANSQHAGLFATGNFDLLGVFGGASALSDDQKPNAPDACAQPPQSAFMAAWYPAEGNTNDIAGANNVGTFEGGAAYTAGKVGTFAFNLTGANDIMAPGGGELDVGTGAGITIDAWLSPTNANASPIVEWNNGATFGVHCWENFPAAGQLFCNIVDTAAVTHSFNTTGAPLVSGGGYQHVAFTFNKANGNVAIYYNGVAQATNVATLGAGITPQTTATYNMYIGRRVAGGNPAGSTGFFNGAVDETEIFNVALTGAEVATIYNGGSSDGKCHTSSFQFSTGAAATPENVGNFTFTVTRTGFLDQPAAVNFTTVPGTAVGGAACTAGIDFINTAGTLNFPAFTPSATVNVPICNDAVFESPEAFSGTLVAGSNTGQTIIGSPNTEVVTINDDDSAPIFTASNTSVTEGSPTGTTILTVTVTKTNSSALTHNVTYTTVPSGANPATEGTCGVAGNDYQDASGTLVFGPNDTTKTVDVTVCKDTIVEFNETFTFDLTSVDNGGGALNDGTETINDDDSTFRIVAQNSPQVEGNNAVFRIFRDSNQATITSAQIDVSTLSGTATGGAACGGTVDFITSGATFVFAPGQTFQDFTVTTCDDSINEAAETFQAQLSNAQGAQEDPVAANTIATFTITDNDAAPTFTATAAASQSEGTTPYVVTVTKSGNTTQQTITITYSFINGTATGGATCTAGVDFINSTAGSPLSFAPGDTTKTINVGLCDDAVFESTEAFQVDFGTPSTGGAVTPDPITLTITDNEPVPTISINDVTQLEGNAGAAPFNFTVTLSNATQAPVSITYHTADGPPPNPATGAVGCGPIGIDYTSVVTDTVVIPAGSTTATIPIIVCGDGQFEQNENFQVLLDTTTIGTFSDNNGLGTIVNDDNPPNITIDNVTQAEGDAGTTNFVFTVTRTGTTNLSTVVAFHTANGTAVGGAACGAGIDYVTQAGTVTFANNDPNPSTRTITIQVCGDTVFETNETFFVVIDSATFATFTPGTQGTGTITNDDAAPLVSIAANISQNEGNSGQANMTFTLNRTGNSTEVSGSVNFATSNVSATGGASCTTGVDYITVNTTVTFAPNETTKTVDVPICGDTVTEANEVFNVTLSAGSNLTITGTNPRTGTIVNDDAMTFTINNVSQNEGQAGVSNFVFTVTVTGSSFTQTTVTYQTVDGTATGGGSCIAGIDYVSQPPNSTLFVPAGATTATITVPVCGDLTLEGNETFQVLLTGASLGTITQGAIGTANSGTGTILNDDGSVRCIGGNIKQYNAPAANTNLAGVTVTLSGTSAGTTTTDASGNYQFCNLLSGGNYLVTPSGLGRTYDPTSRSYTNVTVDITNADFLAYGAPGANNPRTLTIGNGYTTPGQPATVPVNLQSQGNEASLSFSINYDPTKLSSPTVTCGSSVPGCTLLVNTTVAGQIGVSVDAPSPNPPTIGTFAAGLRNVINITFNTTANPPNNAVNTGLTFGDIPTIRRTSDANGNPLPTVYIDSTSGTTGFVVFAQGFESDVAPRPNGDGLLLATDPVQERRFIVGLDTPNPASNEFQRADTAPSATLGNGVLDATDIVQVRNDVTFQNFRAAGGPMQPIPTPTPLPKPAQGVAEAKVLGTDAPSNPRQVQVVSRAGQAGSQFPVTVQLVSDGNEVALSFTLTFPVAKLQYVSAALGPDVPGGCALTQNPNQVANGQLGVLIDCANTFTAGTRNMLLVTFAAPVGTTGTAAVGFACPPNPGGVTPCSTSDANGNLLATPYVGGLVTFTPTAADVSVGGRVTLPSGQGLRNAEVYLQDLSGNRRIAMTSSLGYYQFDEVESGQTYIIGVSSKRYHFEARTVSVGDSLTDVDFISQ